MISQIKRRMTTRTREIKMSEEVDNVTPGMFRPFNSETTSQVMLPSTSMISGTISKSILQPVMSSTISKSILQPVMSKTTSQGMIPSMIAANDGTLSHDKMVSFTRLVIKKKEIQKSPSWLNLIWRVMIKEHFLFVILAIVIGVGLGAYFRSLNVSSDHLVERELIFLRFPGVIVLNAFHIIIVPYFVTALINGITSFQSGNSAIIALKNIVYCFSTTVMAALFGIAVALVLRPGGHQKKYISMPSTKDEHIETLELFLDLIRQMFPPNIVQACFEKVETTFKEKNGTSHKEYEPQLQYKRGSNMLGLAVFSIAVGIATHKLHDAGEPLKLAVVSLCQASTLFLRYIIWLTPIGILFLVAAHIVEMDDPVEVFLTHGYYILTVILALSIHGFLVLPLIYLVIVRKNPFQFIKILQPSIRLALTTSSSSETLPMTMRNLTDNKINHRILSYVIPVGATVNMHGLAIYMTISCIFYGQLEGFDINAVHLINLCLVSIAAAIGSEGIPRSGIIALILVLSTIGHPIKNVGLILAADWILDRFCTVVNILGDAIGAGVIEKLCQTEIKRLDTNEVFEKVDENDLILLRIKDVIETHQCQSVSIYRGKEQPKIANPAKSLFDKSQSFFAELLTSDAHEVNYINSSTSV